MIGSGLLVWVTLY